MGNLNKVTYVDHQTVITADSLNAIQDSIIQNTSYITCSTAANTAAKTATLANFVLTTGSAVKVKFTNTNTAANPTLNINSTGAKPIMQYGTTAAGITPPESWNDGAVVEFVYDGTNWVMQGRNTIDAVSKSGGTFTGDVVINDEGATTSSEVSLLTLGNSTATGTVGNSNGMVRMYGQGDKYLQIRPTTTSGTYTTANRTIVFPDADGTVMLNTGGTFAGTVYINRADGTTSATGTSTLWVGNSTPTGTAGNSKGQVVIYGNGANYVNIQATNATGNRTVELPNENGTLALVENSVQKTGATMSGNLIINRQDGTASTIGWSQISLGNTISSGTVGNSAGGVVFYPPNGAHYSHLRTVATLTANRSITLPDASGTIQLVEDHTVSEGSRVTTNVPSETMTTIATLSLGSGKWVIVGGFEFSSSFTQGTVAALSNGSSQLCGVRGTGANGGGWNMTAIETVSSTTTISLQAYQGSGSAKTVKNIMLRAIKIA